MKTHYTESFKTLTLQCRVSTINSDKMIMKTKIVLCFIGMLSTTFIYSQIPNSGFENWATTGNYQTPIGWATMNTASTGSFYSGTKSTDHYPSIAGDYSIRLENNTSLTQATGSYGMAITKAFDYPYKPAFSLSGHPATLTGYYKFNSMNNDSMFIRVVLFQNGIMQGHYEFITNISKSDWTSFSIALNYTTADSATILMSAFYPSCPTCGPKGNSVLYVDNLNFNTLIPANIAQPVLNYSSTHSIGTQSTMYYIGGTTTPILQSGANVSCDLSSNTLSPLGTFNVVNPSSTPFSSSYPTANVAYEINSTSSGFSYVYLIDSPSEQYKVAENIGGTNPVIYSTYKKAIQYPYKYSDSFSSTFQTTTGSPLIHTSTYDAYGTLTINNKTYTNVIRISGSGGGITWILTTPVAFPIIWKSDGYYFYNEPTAYAGIDNLNANTQLFIYPNPATDGFYIGLDGKNANVSIFNMNGMLVLSTTAVDKAFINISALTRGMYIVKITTDERTIERKLVKK